MAWLFLFDIVFLILLIPLFDRVIYPALDRRGFMFSPQLRIMIGMIFSMCSMTVAGLLEMYRLQVYWKNGTQHIYWQTVGMHDGESNIFEDTNNLMQNQFCMFVGIYTEIIACYNNNNS